MTSLHYVEIEIDRLFRTRKDEHKEADKISENIRLQEENRQWHNMEGFREFISIRKLCCVDQKYVL